jgi:hypothetical protein
MAAIAESKVRIAEVRLQIAEVTAYVISARR